MTRKSARRKKSHQPVPEKEKEIWFKPFVYLTKEDKRAQVLDIRFFFDRLAKNKNYHPGNEYIFFCNVPKINVHDYSKYVVIPTAYNKAGELMPDFVSVFARKGP